MAEQQFCASCGCRLVNPFGALRAVRRVVVTVWRPRDWRRIEDALR